MDKANKAAEVLATHIRNNNFAGVMRMLRASYDANYAEGYYGVVAATYGARKCFHALLVHGYDLEKYGQKVWDAWRKFGDSARFGKFLADRIDELELLLGRQIVVRENMLGEDK